jgi:DNA-binding protein YbaB
MSTPFDSEMESLVAQYQQRRQQAVEAQRKLRELAVTATSAKREVAVTVGSGGDLKEVSFPSEAYRSLAPAELGSLVTKTAAAARKKATAAATKILTGIFPDQPNIAEMYSGQVDVEELLPAEPVLPDFLQEILNGT